MFGWQVPVDVGDARQVRVGDYVQVRVTQATSRTLVSEPVKILTQSLSVAR